MGNKEVNLERGILVSPEDEDLLDSFRWCISNSGYATRNSHRKTILMHRIVLERLIGRVLNPGEVADHINRVTVDNRRENLRVASFGQNAANSKGRAASGYKGVYTAKNGWAVRICANNTHIYIGYFKDPKQAHEAYITAARKYFGEFARFE